MCFSRRYSSIPWWDSSTPSPLCFQPEYGNATWPPPTLFMFTVPNSSRSAPSVAMRRSRVYR